MGSVGPWTAVVGVECDCRSKLASGFSFRRDGRYTFRTFAIGGVLRESSHVD